MEARKMSSKVEMPQDGPAENLGGGLDWSMTALCKEPHLLLLSRF